MKKLPIKFIVSLSNGYQLYIKKKKEMSEKMSKKIKLTFISVIALLGLTLLSLSISPSNAFAQEKQTHQAMGVLDLSKIDLNEDVTITEDGYILEKVSYEEMIQDIATKRGVSIEEITRENSIFSKSDIQPMASPYYYLHIRRDLPINGWVPQLDIYVYMYGSGSFNAFKEIKDINLIRSYNYQSKQFSGKAEATLFSGAHLYWVVNGDFYNNGSTQSSFEASVGFGKAAKTTFSVTGSNNHFGYVYRTGDINF